MKHHRHCVSCNQVELVIVSVSRPTRYGSIDSTEISQTSNFGLITTERSAFKNWLWGDRTLHVKVLETQTDAANSLSGIIKGLQSEVVKVSVWSSRRIVMFVYQCLTAAQLLCHTKHNFPLKGPTVNWICWCSLRNRTRATILCRIIHVTLTWLFWCDVSSVEDNRQNVFEVFVF